MRKNPHQLINIKLMIIGYVLLIIVFFVAARLLMGTP
jgi:hypothetical protein